MGKQADSLISKVRHVLAGDSNTPVTTTPYILNYAFSIADASAESPALAAGTAVLIAT
jgi:hypothetical protein